ncbi:MAG: SDR family oxidoreductase [Sphingomonadaceae bacterium]|nr:SDR family oxidoreductase [Sphingomonadaceae bacterium]
MRFSGKRAIVTGAASGIGRATAQRLASEGAALVIADVNEAGLAETLASLDGDHRAVPFDASNVASCHALVADATSTGPLDVLCNIAGMLDWGPTASFEEARFNRLLQINLVGVFAMCRAAIPHLLPSRGNIVNMASTAALDGIAYSAAYTAAKHGVLGLTRSLAVEYAAQGVRVNAVCPGQVDTPMGNQAPPEGDVDWSIVMRSAPKLENGICQPEDIASMVAYLASTDAAKITGSAFTVDGGQLVG